MYKAHNKTYTPINSLNIISQYYTAISQENELYICLDFGCIFEVVLGVEVCSWLDFGLHLVV